MLLHLLTFFTCYILIAKSYEVNDKYNKYLLISYIFLHYFKTIQ